MLHVRIFVLTLVSAAVAACLMAQPFDYYVLSLSWAPAFCSQSGASIRNPRECAIGRGIGFTIHGLWPELTNGRGPESCGPAKPVPKAVEKIALPYMLSPGLIRHEWITHGSCTGLIAFDYFSDIIQARASVQTPVQLTSIEAPLSESPGQIETQFAEANPSFPRSAFRTHCIGRQFEEERVCFDKNLKPRECTPAAGECRAIAVTILPPR